MVGIVMSDVTDNSEDSEPIVVVFIVVVTTIVHPFEEPYQCFRPIFDGLGISLVFLLSA